MIFGPNSTSDIERYYSETWVKFPKLSGDRLWRVSSISYTEVSFEDVDGFTTYLNLSDELEVDFPLPGRVIYQYGTKAACLYRKPAKQYKRGICAHNTGVFSYNNTVLGQPLEEIHITGALLQAFVDKPCYQDVNSLDPSYTSWAITPQIALTKRFVYILKTPVGHVDLDTKQITLLHKNMFFSEIKNAFPNWEIL